MIVLKKDPLPAPPPIRYGSTGGQTQSPPPAQTTTDAGTPQTEPEKPVWQRPQLWLGVSIALLLGYVFYTVKSV